MGNVSVAIHANPQLAHQIEFAEYFQSGFIAHDTDATITSDPQLAADVHVVIGPHYALKQRAPGDRTVYVDRCFWGHHREFVTIGWLRPDGSRHVLGNMDDSRPKPDLAPMKTGDNAIYLCDYGVAPEANLVKRRNAEVRLHPADTNTKEPLDAALDRNDIAIGGMSSALVTAVISGLNSICVDPRSVCFKIEDREQWLNDISWMNWSGSEIKTGEALEYLLCQQY